MVTTIKNFFNSIYTPNESDFQNNGYITPDQFYQSGDQLVGLGWKWEKAVDAKKKHKQLSDPNRQFLSIEGRSQIRIKDAFNFDFKEGVTQDGEWATFDQNSKNQQGEEIQSQIRSYKISITYDDYYHCPRMWLSCTDEDGNVLNRNQIFEDITAEHQGETVTFEDHPHLGVKQVTIHPCKHTERMKILLQQAKAKGKIYQPHEALLIFLKFMQSIIPTIEYDCTIDLDF